MTSRINYEDMTHGELYEHRNMINQELMRRRPQVMEEVRATFAKFGVTAEEVINMTFAPKYRNPENPEETYKGKGPKPKWLKEALATGKKLEDFAV